MAEQIPLGVMVETPASVFAIDLIAREADFVSIGTNDLIQYTLAVDRGNENLAEVYEPLHPAVLRAIRAVVEAGQRFGIRVGICGEMAGEPLYAVLLLGLGVADLSVSPYLLPEIKTILRASTYEEAVGLRAALPQPLHALGGADDRDRLHEPALPAVLLPRDAGAPDHAGARRSQRRARLDPQGMGARIESFPEQPAPAPRSRLRRSRGSRPCARAGWSSSAWAARPSRPISRALADREGAVPARGPALSPPSWLQRDDFLVFSSYSGETAGDPIGLPGDPPARPAPASSRRVERWPPRRGRPGFPPPSFRPDRRPERPWGGPFRPSRTSPPTSGPRPIWRGGWRGPPSGWSRWYPPAGPVCYTHATWPKNWRYAWQTVRFW